MAGAQAEFRAGVAAERRLHVLVAQWLGWKALRRSVGASGFLPHDDILFGEMTTRQKKLERAGEMAGRRKV